MEKSVMIKAIEEYQCSGCSKGSGISCYERGSIANECGAHSADTYVTGVGKILLGMPKGFNRYGTCNEMKLAIYEKFKDSEWTFDKFNVPIWKYKNELGHTLVRGIMPRRNEPFIHIFLEDCLDKIQCLEITDSDIRGMD